MQPLVFINNYLKTAIRNISKNKAFSLLNIIGLAISLSVGLLMLTFINELEEYDEFHAKSERIYRIVNTYKYLEDDPNNFASTSILAGKTVQESVEGIEALTIIRRNASFDLGSGDTRIPLEGMYASNGFFSIFSFPMISGDSKTALVGLNNIVLTKSAAEKLFGEEDPLGKVIVNEDEESFTITGIVTDPPFNSHMDFDFLVSFATIDEKNKDSNRWMRWSNMWMNHVYLLLETGIKPKDIQPAFDRISEVENAKNEYTEITIGLQALTDITPGPSLSNQLGKNMESNILWMIAGLAFIIVISACFNYTNLSIARSMRRSREVGVRKVVGASSMQIFSQFIIESVLVSLISLVFAVGIFYLLKPYFLSLDENISGMVNLNLSAGLLLQFIALAILAGLIAGVLPATIFSKFNPQNVLKNSSSVKLFKGLTMRKILIVTQFTLSIMFILAATLEFKQYRHALSFDLGYSTENIINLRLQDNVMQHIKTEMEKIPEVEMISASMMITSVGNYWGGTLKYEDPLDSISVYYNGVDENYIPLHDHKLIAGINFIPKLNDSSSTQVIVNEKVIKRFNIGTPEESIGKALEFEGKEATIVGVIPDFHYGTIQSEIRPFMFRYTTDEYYRLNIKVVSTDIFSTYNKIEEAWQRVDDIHPMEASFYDDRIQEAYSMYSVMVKIIGYLAFLAISIAVMGLLGMVMFTTETRLKEISIRKVLGASEQGLIFLLGKGFMLLLLIAAVLAIPTTYYLFEKFVFDGISYRAPIGALDLFSGTIFVMIVAVIAISTQTIGASRTNPANVLRNE